MDDHGSGLNHDEGSVVARAQDGNLAAFEQLVMAYQDRLFRLAYRMLNNRSDAEDIVQETLLTGWRSLPMLVNVDAFGGWLYRLATNQCLDSLRKRSTHPETITDPEELLLTARSGSPQDSSSMDPASRAELSAQQRELTKMLKTLPPAQRACWLLREIHGRSYAEISDTLKLSPATVRGTLARARQKIAGGMRPWY